jgi:GT2 family glycosyltransferase
MPARPRISVVVALNHHEHPEAHVPRLGRQTAPLESFEVVVVDGRRRGDARPAIERARRAGSAGLDIRCVRVAACGRGAALNAGIAATTGEVVLLLAGDGLAPADFVAKHAAFHERETAVEAAALGPFLFPDSLRRDPYRRWLEDSGRLFGASFTRPDAEALSRFWFVANTSVKRALFERVGPFDERFDLAGDDEDMGRRLFAAGMRLTYLPDAVLEHDHEVTPSERARLLRQAGSAAAFSWTGSHPAPWWERKVSHSSFTMARRALAARVAATLLGGPARRERAWTLSADAAFASGFRSARRNSTVS